MILEKSVTLFESEDYFNDWVKAFCELEANAYENPTNLFNSFKTFAEEINEPTGTNREFRYRIEKAGFTRGSSSAKSGRCWQGLKLR